MDDITVYLKMLGIINWCKLLEIENHEGKSLKNSRHVPVSKPYDDENYWKSSKVIF